MCVTLNNEFLVFLIDPEDRPADLLDFQAVPDLFLDALSLEAS